MQESQIDKVLNSASQRQESTTAGGHHGVLETQISLTSNVFFQEFQQVTGGFKKWNHEERNIWYTQDIKVSKLPTLKIHKWCYQGLVLIAKRRVFRGWNMKAHSRKKVEKSKDFKRGNRSVFPPPQFCLDWVLDPIPRQSNLPLALQLGVKWPTVHYILVQRGRRKDHFKTQWFPRLPCLCVRVGWLAGWVAGAGDRGRCSCGGKHQSRPRPQGPLGRLWFQVEADHWAKLQSWRLRKENLNSFTK